MSNPDLTQPNALAVVDDAHVEVMNRIFKWGELATAMVEAHQQLGHVPHFTRKQEEELIRDLAWMDTVCRALSELS